MLSSETIAMQTNRAEGTFSDLDQPRDAVEGLCRLANRGNEKAIQYLGKIGANTLKYTPEISKMARNCLGGKNKGR